MIQESSSHPNPRWRKADSNPQSQQETNEDPSALAWKRKNCGIRLRDGMASPEAVRSTVAGWIGGPIAVKVAARDLLPFM